MPHPLTAEQHARLAAYAHRLAAAAAVMSLTTVRDPAGIERRHLGESLALARTLAAAAVLPAGAAVIDVGSGGGLPGIPLAIARPDLHVALLEATAKKAAFLAETVTALGLDNVAVLAVRAEDAGRDPAHRERYDLAVARAVAPLPTLAELTLPLVRVGGHVAAVKGSRHAREIAAATAAIARCGGRVAGVLPLAGAETGPLVVVLLAKDRPTPPELPRRAGVPARRPLR
jgi:16S rRNA (guanine527-N7)-methyltransferase